MVLAGAENAVRRRDVRIAAGALSLSVPPLPSPTPERFLLKRNHRNRSGSLSFYGCSRRGLPLPRAPESGSAPGAGAAQASEDVRK